MPDAPVVTPDAPAAVAISLSTAGGSGDHLVDSQGKTLYVFANDVAGTNLSACTGACLTTWPAFDVQSPTVGTGLTATDFSRFDRGAGVFQTTWKGRPLYYYAADTAAAPTSGENKGPGRWFIARTYNLYLGANTTVTPLGGVANAPFLTNGAGRTLYVFKNDTPGTGTTAPVSACTAAPCSTSWPAWVKPATLTNVVLPSTIPATDVSSFTNGTMQQFTFKGWPLYFFSADTMPGQVAGAAVLNWATVNAAWNGVFP